MNNQIEKLAEQALNEYKATWHNEARIPEAYLEKFAELIVREMLQTCEDHPAWTGRMIGEEIKQHFGVEL